MLSVLASLELGSIYMLCADVLFRIPMVDGCLRRRYGPTHSTGVVEREPGVQEAMLFRHKRTPFAASFGDVWYAGIRRDARRILADLQALTHVSDDMLGTRGDTTSSLALGNRVAVERLSIATLVVVASPMETTSSCRPVIDIAVSILSRGV